MLYIISLKWVTMVRQFLLTQNELSISDCIINSDMYVWSNRCFCMLPWCSPSIFVQGPLFSTMWMLVCIPRSWNILFLQIRRAKNWLAFLKLYSQALDLMDFGLTRQLYFWQIKLDSSETFYTTQTLFWQIILVWIGHSIPLKILF